MVKKKRTIHLYKYQDQAIYEEQNVKVVHYELITRRQLQELDKSDAMVVIPVGLMEVHGWFLPLGTDYIESIGWGNHLVPDVLKNRRPDKEYTIVLFPPVPIGTGGIRGMKGTVNTGRKEFRKVMMDIVDGLVYAGFRRFFLTTAHHGNTHGTCLEEVVHKGMKKYRSLDVRIASPVNHFVQRAFVSTDKSYWDNIAADAGVDPLTDEDYRAIRNDHHSSLMEIGFIKEINEHWVDPEYKDSDLHLEGVDHSIKSLIAKRWSHLGGIDGCGYNGDPSKSDERDWFALYNEVIRQLSVEMIDALYDEDPKNFKPYLSSFQWKLKLLKTDLKWWFITPLLLFLFILPWILLALPSNLREMITFWSVIALIGGYILGTALFVAYNIRQIKALKQESH